MTIEAKDAQIGVTYTNKTGMLATYLGEGLFRTEFGDIDIEPDEPLTEVGAQAPAADEEVVPPVVVERFIETPAMPELPEEQASVDVPAASTAVEPVAVEAPVVASAEKAARPRCVCSECGEDYSLVKGDVVRRHWRGARVEENLCPGSGKPPKGEAVEVAVVPVAEVAKRWPPAVGDRVLIADKGDAPTHEVVTIAAVDPTHPSGPYCVQWDTGEVTGGWRLFELRPAEDEPAVASPSPGDTFQVQEPAAEVTPEAVCAETADPEDGEEGPPVEGVPLAFSVPPEREETVADFIEGIPELGDEPETRAEPLRWRLEPTLASWMGAVVASVAASVDAEEGWLDCDTDPPYDREDVIAETVSGARRMARVREVASEGSFFIDSGDMKGYRVKRWKPWKKAQPDQSAEIARLTAAVAAAQAERDEARDAQYKAMEALAKIGVIASEGRTPTEVDAAQKLSVAENRDALVSRICRLVEENEAHRVAERNRPPAHFEVKVAALQELIGSLRAQLEVADGKAMRYHAAARRSAEATLAALGDEP